jgi:ubiquinone/menaquinone biosynthesis C-methylase UbiE
MTQPPICDYEGSPYQSVFWEQADRRYEDLSEAFALRALLPPGGEILLELGAGAGRNTQRYSGYKHIVLVDYSLSQLEQAQLRLADSSRFTYVAANIYNLPFSSSHFDAATLIRTLHHMTNPSAALKEIRRTLQPGAFFLMEYANKRNAKSILRFLLKHQDWNPFSLDQVEFAHLNFNFHPDAIHRYLTDADFSIQQQRTVSHFRSALLKKIFPAGMLARVDSAVGKTGNLFQLSPSVFISARASSSGEAKSMALFRCPACQSQNLSDQRAATNAHLLCTDCGRRWEVRGNIYDFRGSISE